ncbi:MAG: M12 family metallo-peptidase, partial [Nanoarchaeota archaeon]
MTLEGTVEIVHYDGANSFFEFYINTGDATYKLQFSQADIEKISISGQNIRISGNFVNTASEESMFGVDSLEILDSGVVAGSGVSSLGEQRTAVILVNFNNNPSNAPMSLQDVRDRFFDASRQKSINSYMRESSYNQTFLSGDVYGWYTLPFSQSAFSTQKCGLGMLRDGAISVASQFVNFVNYDRVFFVFPSTSCPYSGLGTVGWLNVNVPSQGTFPLSLSAISNPTYIDSGTAAHEFGHNLGVFHSGDLECGSSPFQSSCYSSANIEEYGDIFDIMGTSFYYAHYGAYHKSRFGWLSSSQVKMHNRQTPVAVNIEPIETSSLGIKTLRVPFEPTTDIDSITDSYYIEYRRPIGFDLSIYNS